MTLWTISLPEPHCNSGNSPGGDEKTCLGSRGSPNALHSRFCLAPCIVQHRATCATWAACELSPLSKKAPLCQCQTFLLVILVQQTSLLRGSLLFGSISIISICANICLASLCFFMMSGHSYHSSCSCVELRCQILPRTLMIKNNSTI